MTLHGIISLTWDGTSQRFYKDGSEVGSATGTGTFVSMNSIRMGNTMTGSAYFNGMLDEVVIYNRALTAAEVLERFNNNWLLKNLLPGDIKKQ